MPKPPRAAEVKSKNIESGAGSILTLLTPTKQALQARSQHLSSQRRSPQSEAHQLNLLAPLKPQEPALRIEPIPVKLTVGVKPRFWLIHQESGLRVPGQFSRVEAEYIFKTTAEWDWEIRHRPRTPNCSNRLLGLLKTVCTPQTHEVAA